MSELVDAASATYGVEIRLATIVAQSPIAIAALRRASLPKKVRIRRAEIERWVPFTCSLP
jgi:hypothetical protein